MAKTSTGEKVQKTRSKSPSHPRNFENIEIDIKRKEEEEEKENKSIIQRTNRKEKEKKRRRSIKCIIDDYFSKKKKKEKKRNTCVTVFAMRVCRKHRHVSPARKSRERHTLYRTDLCPSFATDQSRASPDGRLDQWSFPTRRRGSRAKSRSVLRDEVASSLGVATHLAGKGGYDPPCSCTGCLRLCVHPLCVCTRVVYTRVYRGCCPIGCRSCLSPLTVAILAGITGRSSTRSTCF